MNIKKIALLVPLFVALLVPSMYAQQGLVGEYYNGTNFERKVLTRVDSRIHFSWYNKGPAPGMNESDYSIRWTGRIKTPKSGKYKFSAKVDDGIRLWVDNKKIMDAWRPNDWGEFEGNIELAANQVYNLKVEYYNGIYEGEIQLYWVLPGEGNAISNYFGRSAKPIEAQYFLLPETKNNNEIAAFSVTGTNPPQQQRDKPTPTVPKKKSPEAKKRQPPAATGSTSATPAPPQPSVEELQRRQKDLELKPIYFVRSTDEILPASREILDNWAVFLKQKPDANIEVRGHTDDLGNPEKNQELSEQRAALVAKYLVEHGIEQTKITALGCGGNKPIFVNPANDKERALNRRVEIRVRR